MTSILKQGVFVRILTGKQFLFFNSPQILNIFCFKIGQEGQNDIFIYLNMF